MRERDGDYRPCAAANGKENQISSPRIFVQLKPGGVRDALFKATIPYSPTVVACNLASSEDRANDNHWLNPSNAVGLASVGKRPRTDSSIVASPYLLRKTGDVQDRSTQISSANLRKYWNSSVIGFEQCREIGMTTPASASCTYRCGARVDCLRTAEQECHQNNQTIV